jgi:predicted ABC-type sugar transport system permease subunit
MAWILTTQMPHDATGGVLAFWIATAFVAGFLLCLAIGFLTGVIVAVIGVHPILVTLGTQTLVSGISIWLTHGRTLSGFPEPLLLISNGTIFGIPISFIVFAVMAAAVHILLTRTPLGIRIHMVGSNLESTRFSGCRYAAGADLGLRPVESPLLAGGHHHDGSLQFRGREHRAILPSNHHPGRHPRWHRSLWRIWAHRRPGHIAGYPPDDFQWL